MDMSYALCNLLKFLFSFMLLYPSLDVVNTLDENIFGSFLIK
jgi:hypothetical protein